MANSKSSDGWWRPLFCLAAFLLFGCVAGVAWFAALMPIGAMGALLYDLSRYGFAVSVLVAVVSLSFRPWREYGLGVFIVGLLLGIALQAFLLPAGVQLGQRLVAVMFLFGFPLGIIVLLSGGFLLACRRNRRQERLEGESESPAAAPRRFGMGTLLIVVLAVSLGFAAAKRLEIPPVLTLLVGSFLGIIGGLQMAMNKVPRAASVGTGAVLLPLTLATSGLATGASSHPVLGPLMATPADIAFLGAHLVGLGAVCGYIGGALVAGLFLVIELASRPLRRRPVVDPPM